MICPECGQKMREADVLYCDNKECSVGQIIVISTPLLGKMYRISYKMTEVEA